MKGATVRTSMQVGGPTKELIESVVTSSLPPEEILNRLDSYAIEWYLTERGDLMIRYWQVGAEDFLPPEHVGNIQEGRTIPPEANRLEWLSRHLHDLRARYAGEWIAVVGDRVVASSNNFAQLLQQVSDLGEENPFITQIPAGRVIWMTAYARQGF
jgi:hypothetical protein